MKQTRIQSLVLSLALLAPCALVFAQPPTEAPKPAPAAPANTPAPASSQSVSATPPATSATPDEPAKPSDETIKKARAAGYKPEVRQGMTQYCRTDATTGSHFKDKKCVSEQQLTEVINIQAEMKDQMNQTQACAGGSCKGH